MLIDKMFERMPSVSAPMRILLYVCQHTDPKTRIFSRTYDKIQKDLHVGRSTISYTLARLVDAGTMKYLGDGKYYNYIIDEATNDAAGPEFFVERKGK